MATVWDQLEADVLRIYRFPHNVVYLRRERELTPEQAAKTVVQEVRSGLGGAAVRHRFIGPRLFLRSAGPASSAYSGQWWFDADLLHALEAAYARIYFDAADKRRALTDMLRELLAVSADWNTMEEIWALALPPGESLVGYVGRGAPQKLFAKRAVTAAGNRMLVGQAEQIFFPPAHNPLWITKYSGLRP